MMKLMLVQMLVVVSVGRAAVINRQEKTEKTLLQSIKDLLPCTKTYPLQEFPDDFNACNFSQATTDDEMSQICYRTYINLRLLCLWQYDGLPGLTANDTAKELRNVTEEANASSFCSERLEPNLVQLNCSQEQQNLGRQECILYNEDQDVIRSGCASACHDRSTNKVAGACKHLWMSSTLLLKHLKGYTLPGPAEQESGAKGVIVSPAEASVEEGSYKSKGISSTANPKAAKQVLSKPSSLAHPKPAVSSTTASTPAAGPVKPETKKDESHDKEEPKEPAESVIEDPKEESEGAGVDEALKLEGADNGEEATAKSAESSVVEAPVKEPEEEKQEKNKKPDEPKQGHHGMVPEEPQEADKEEHTDDKEKSESEEKSSSKEDSKEPVLPARPVDTTQIEEQSSLFSHFTFIVIVAVILYLVFHNKQKILALVLEGRRGRRNSTGSRRHRSAQYRKLDNNLEEAGLTPGDNTTMRHVIY